MENEDFIKDLSWIDSHCVLAVGCPMQLLC